MQELAIAIRLTCLYYDEVRKYYPPHMQWGAFNNRGGRKSFALYRIEE